MFIWTRPFQGHERSVRQSSDKARSAVARSSPLNPEIGRLEPVVLRAELFVKTGANGKGKPRSEGGKGLPVAALNPFVAGAGAGTRDTVQGAADREDAKSFPERRPKSTGVENGLRGARKAPKPLPDLYLMARCLGRHLNHSGHIGEPGLEQDGEGPKNPEAILPAHTGRGVGRGGAPKTKAITGPQRWDDVDAPDPVFLDQVEDPLKEPRHAKGKEGRSKRVQKRTDRPATVLQLTADGPCPFPKEQRIEEETQGPRDGDGSRRLVFLIFPPGVSTLKKNPGWGGNPGVSSLSVGRAPRKGPQMAGKGGRTVSTPFFGSIGGIEPAGKGCGNIRAGDRREGRRKLQFLGTPARKGKDARPSRVELTQLHKRKRRRENAKAGPPESENRRPPAHDASMQGVTRARQSTEVQSQVGERQSLRAGGTHEAKLPVQRGRPRVDLGPGNRGDLCVLDVLLRRPLQAVVSIELPGGLKPLPWALVEEEGSRQSCSARGTLAIAK